MSSTGPPSLPCLALVSLDLQGVSVVLMVMGMSRLLEGFVGSTVLTGHWSRHDHNGVVALIRCRGCEALGQESPPLVLLAGVLSVWGCPSVCPAPIFLTPALTLEGGAWVTGVVPCQLWLSVSPPRTW
jgi:hypothetical protein